MSQNLTGVVDDDLRDERRLGQFVPKTRGIVPRSGNLFYLFRTHYPVVGLVPLSSQEEGEITQIVRIRVTYPPAAHRLSAPTRT